MRVRRDADPVTAGPVRVPVSNVLMLAPVFLSDSQAFYHKEGIFHAGGGIDQVGEISGRFCKGFGCCLRWVGRASSWARCTNLSPGGRSGLWSRWHQKKDD